MHLQRFYTSFETEDESAPQPAVQRASKPARGGSQGLQERLQHVLLEALDLTMLSGDDKRHIDHGIQARPAKNIGGI